MRIYAERPGRVVRQVCADLAVVVWLVLCVSAALAARDAVLVLQAPAVALADAGDSIRGTFEGAAHTAGGVPFVGADLAGALGVGTGAGDELARAGQAQVAAIGTLADATAIGITSLGVLPVLVVWLILRMRYARRAASAIRARHTDIDLLALRALNRRPVRRLLAVAGQPAQAWRSGDPAVLAALAAIELRGLGLRPPPMPPSPGRIDEPDQGSPTAEIA